jgi:Flp pilus assembly pilin Flp
MHSLIAAAVAYVVGAFTPSIGRKIKSWFSKETTAAITTVTKKL